MDARRGDKNGGAARFERSTIQGAHTKPTPLPNPALPSLTDSDQRKLSDMNIE